jgi:transglutaminase-like putative cysteine protease/uncharacterized protein (DUF58 family)
MARSGPAEDAGAARRPRSAAPRLTREAWALGLLALGLLGAAVNTGNNLLYLLFSLLAGAVPVSAFLSWRNLRCLDVDLVLPAAPSAGVPFAVDVEITNRHPRASARSLVVALATDQGELGTARVERVKPGTTRLTLLSRWRRRGPLQVLETQVGSTFPLGILRRSRSFGRSEALLVLPAVTTPSQAGRRPADVHGSSVPTPRVAGSEYFALRRGSVEDDLRKVDWKVTARRGVLMVRETTGEGRQEIALNVRTRRAGPPREARERFEEHVSAVAGAARSVLLGGGVARLTVDGAGGVEYAGRGGLLRLLRRLATLEPVGADGAALPPRDLPPEPPREAPTSPWPRDTAPGRALRASAIATLAIGTVTLFACGGIGLSSFAAIAATLAVTALSPRAVTRHGSVMDLAWKAAAVVALVFFFVDIFDVRHNLLASSTGLLVFITLFALFAARQPADDGRLLLLSFLQMILAGAMTTDVGLALPLAGWMLAAAHGMIAATALPSAEGGERHVVDPGGARVRYAGPALRAAAATAAASVAVFLAVPHFGTGTFRPGALQQQRVSGFSDSARLGDIGLIKLDDSKVMEIVLSGPAVPADDLKWRGVALDRFDGRVWTRTPSTRRRLLADGRGRFFLFPGDAEPTAGRVEFEQEVRLEPVDSTVVFAANRPRVLASTDFRILGEDAFGNLEFRMRPGRRLSYTVASVPPSRDPPRLRGASERDPESVRETNLTLPPLDARIGRLARRVAAGAPTRFDAVSALEAWLSTNLEYSLDVRDRGVDDPLSAFLFGGMAGHCEYFATAMVVMSRELGIPSRFVTGYLRGEGSRFGRRFVVRQSDAHSWVEVYFPGVGWVAFDPTPAVGREVGETPGLRDLASFLHSSVARLWDDYLIGIDLDDQARGLMAVAGTLSAWTERLTRLSTPAFAGRRLGWLVAGAIAVALVYAARRGLRLLRAWPLRRGRAWGAFPSRTPPAFYRQATDLLARRGLLRRPGETPAEFARRTGDTLGALGAEPLAELTRLYYRVRFDDRTSERSVAATARSLVGDVRRAILLHRSPGRTGNPV